MLFFVWFLLKLKKTSGNKKQPVVEGGGGEGEREVAAAQRLAGAHLWGKPREGADSGTWICSFCVLD